MHEFFNSFPTFQSFYSVFFTITIGININYYVIKNRFAAISQTTCECKKLLKQQNILYADFATVYIVRLEMVLPYYVLHEVMREVVCTESFYYKITPCTKLNVRPHYF